MPLALHVRDVLLLLVALLGPVPLCVALAASSSAARGVAHRVLVISLCWITLETGLLLVLGLTGRLSLPWLMVSEAALFLVGWLVLSRSRPLTPLRTTLTSYEALLLGAVATLGAALLWVLSAYPTNEWDSLAYHLPAVAQWYQTGHLARLPHDLLQTACYPYGWELLCSLFVFPFRRDFLALLPNLMAWALLGVAAYGLARELGATRGAGLASAAALLSLPGVIENVNSLHIDLAMAAFITAAAYFTMVYARTGERREACYGLGALALACGTKSSALLYVPPLVLALLLLPRLWRTQGPRQPVVPSGLLPLAGVLGAWGVAGFWYVRNYLELNNPMAPVTVRLGSHVLFPGYIEAAALRPVTIFYMLHATDWQSWRTLASALRGFGGWPFLVLGGIALLALLRPRRRVLLALVWVAITILLYVLTPFSGDSGAHHGQMDMSYVDSQMRIGFPFLVAVAVLAALGMTAWPVLQPLFVAGAVGSVLLALASLRLAPLALLAVFGVAVYRLVVARLSGFVLSRAGRGAMIGLCAVVLLLGTYVARGRREAHALAIYGSVPGYLERQVSPGSPTGYLFCAQNYLLYGPDLSRRVVHIPPRTPDPAEWHAFLSRNRLEVVAMGPDKGTFSPAQRQLAVWLTSPAGPLVTLYAPGPDQMTLYRVKPGWRSVAAPMLPSR